MAEHGLNIRNKLHERALNQLARWAWSREYEPMVERKRLLRILEVPGYTVTSLTWLLRAALEYDPVAWRRMDKMNVAHYKLPAQGYTLVVHIRALQERMEELRKGLRGRAELPPVRQPALDESPAGAPEVVAPGGGVDVE